MFSLEEIQAMYGLYEDMSEEVAFKCIKHAPYALIGLSKHIISEDLILHAIKHDFLLVSGIHTFTLLNPYMTPKILIEILIFFPFLTPDSPFTPDEFIFHSVYMKNPEIFHWRHLFEPKITDELLLSYGKPPNDLNNRLIELLLRPIRTFTQRDLWLFLPYEVDRVYAIALALDTSTIPRDIIKMLLPFIF